MELRSQGRSQMEFGNEGTKASSRGDSDTLDVDERALSLVAVARRRDGPQGHAVRTVATARNGYHHIA